MYSFEPDKRNFRMLKSYVRRLPNVTVFNEAVGKVDGHVALKVSDNDFFSAVSSVHGLKGKNYVREYLVKSTRMDSLTLDRDPSVVVLDCEGAETDVVAGGERTLGSVGVVLAETHVLTGGLDTAQDLRSALTAAGFGNVSETVLPVSGTCPAGSGAPPGPSAPESTTSSASTSTSSAGTTGLTPQAKSDAEMLILAALALSLIGSIGYAIAGRKKRPVNDHRGFE